MDPHGLFNILIGGGVSAVAGLGGVEASSGNAFNPTLSGINTGRFASVGTGGGFNMSADAFFGITRGNIGDLAGLTANVNVSVGPFSLTLMYDMNGNFFGFTFGGGPSMAPVGVSGTLSYTGVLDGLIGDPTEFLPKPPWAPLFLRGEVLMHCPEMAESKDTGTKLLAGHFVTPGQRLALLLRTFDLGSLFAVDDERCYEKLTIEITH